MWGGFGFGGGSDSRNSRAQADDGGFVPTKSDFDRNFDMSASADYDNDGNGQYGYDDDEYSQDDDGGEYPDPDTPLVPGLYRALYAFEPEGTAEMALVEDQIVRIIGRGGGVGWAIAVREGDSGSEGEVGEKHALVPEGYLELVKADGDEED